MSPSKRIDRMMKMVAKIDGTSDTVGFATVNYYCEVGSEVDFWIEISSDGKTARHEGITFGTLFDIIRGLVLSDYGAE